MKISDEYCKGLQGPMVLWTCNYDERATDGDVYCVFGLVQKSGNQQGQIYEERLDFNPRSDTAASIKQVLQARAEELIEKAKL